MSYYFAGYNLCTKSHKKRHFFRVFAHFCQFSGYFCPFPSGFPLFLRTKRRLWKSIERFPRVFRGNWTPWDNLCVKSSNVCYKTTRFCLFLDKNDGFPPFLGDDRDFDQKSRAFSPCFSRLIPISGFCCMIPSGFPSFLRVWRWVKMRIPQVCSSLDSPIGLRREACVFPDGFPPIGLRR